MVLVILDDFTFEASKFVTRTMPTPDMKTKEVIYWIKVETTDKRLATDLQRFLDGSAQFIKLNVPSAFVSVQCELESYKRPVKLPSQTHPRAEKTDETQTALQQEDHEEKYAVEILLRRQLRESKTGQTQAPYG